MYNKLRSEATVHVKRQDLVFKHICSFRCHSTMTHKKGFETSFRIHRLNRIKVVVVVKTDAPRSERRKKGKGRSDVTLGVGEQQDKAEVT